MEHLDGEHTCDFCHELSNNPAKLEISYRTYICCKECERKIADAIHEWYRWVNLPVDMMTDALRKDE